MKILFIAGILCSLVFPLYSEEMTPTVSLSQAKVTEIKGDVVVKRGGHTDDQKVELNQIVKPSDIIRTAKNSRLELEFPDGSVCRVGSDTVFSFDPNTRDMGILRGVAVVHVPPQKGGAQILTPAARARIQGDTLAIMATHMEGIPVTHFTALSPRGGPTDGNIMITLNRRPQISFPLQGGHLAIVRQDVNSLAKIPRVEIDVKTFVSHSPIMANLPSTAKTEVNMVAKNQAKAIASGATRRSNFAVVGSQVVKADAKGQFTTKSALASNGKATGHPESVGKTPFSDMHQAIRTTGVNAGSLAAVHSQSRLVQAHKKHPKKK